MRAQWAMLAVVVVLSTLGAATCAPPSMGEALVRPPVRPEEGLIDLRQDGGPPVRRGIPNKPASWQKRPPCPKEMGEREISGACYFRIHPDDMKPPCRSPAMEHGEFCWRAVAKPPREPSSIAD